MPFKKPFFRPKGRGPIKKRVAPSDSSKNFGLGGMSPKFFYHDRIARQKGIIWSFSFKNWKIVIFTIFTIFECAPSRFWRFFLLLQKLHLKHNFLAFGEWRNSGSRYLHYYHTPPEYDSKYAKIWPILSARPLDSDVFFCFLKNCT